MSFASSMLGVASGKSNALQRAASPMINKFQPGQTAGIMQSPTSRERNMMNRQQPMSPTGIGPSWIKQGSTMQQMPADRTMQGGGMTRPPMQGGFRPPMMGGARPQIPMPTPQQPPPMQQGEEQQLMRPQVEPQGPMMQGQVGQGIGPNPQMMQQLMQQMMQRGQMGRMQPQVMY